MEPTPAEAVTTSVSGRTLIITLNRPEVKNAINSDLSKGVLAALQQLDEDDELRVGVLVGSGGTFCAGLDLQHFAKHGLPKGVGKLYRHGARKPLIAAIEGVAMGGGLELALVADLLVGAEDAKLGSTEVRFGLFPGGGALLKLPKFLPQSLVADMAMTGRALSAKEAYDRGLLARLTPPGGALEEALSLAESIARNAPLGVAATKQLLRATPGLTEEELWATQLELVNDVFTSDDAKEGARAFAERREPQWQGR